MRPFLFLSLILLCSNCAKNPDDYIESLNGYWEIESVTLANGTERTYTFNETIDYFSISDSLKGFRKKLKPNFSGTYKTSQDAETITLKIENDSLNIYYKTAFDAWKETVLLANKNQLKIINQNKDVFLYKRFTPIKID